MSPPLTVAIRPVQSVRRWFRCLFPHTPPDFAALWERTCQKWLIGHLAAEGAELSVGGWLAAPPELRPHVDFRMNGRAPSLMNYPLPRPDVAARHDYEPNGAESGFHFKVPLDDPTQPPDLELTPIDRRTGQPLGEHYRSLFVPSAERFGPSPTSNRRARVIGSSSDLDFRLGGYTTFRQLEAAVRDATGESLAASPRVLDWGCGCARVSRYFLPLPGVSVTGVDVDPDNVGWCEESLPQGRWQVVPLRPPTDLPTAGYDLAFGVSVFTHLKEPEQFAWLAELSRVIRPGGLALMTFHGDASIVWSGLSPERYSVLRRQGICDLENPIYDANLPEADYYRDTFHTESYIRRVWGRAFEILAIRPCFLSHQDLVVMRRRA